MATSSEYSIDKPELAELVAQLAQCGEVISVFFKPKPPVLPHSQVEHPLKELFASDAFFEVATKLGRILKVNAKYSTLNRLEFEGSLTALLLRGGCHGAAPGLSLEEVRSAVLAGVAAAFPEPFADILAFRIDDERWCQFTDEATLSSSYLVSQPARGLWWLLCVADID